jgi:hypothetical protein
MCYVKGMVVNWKQDLQPLAMSSTILSLCTQDTTTPKFTLPLSCTPIFFLGWWFLQAADHLNAEARAPRDMLMLGLRQPNDPSLASDSNLSSLPLPRKQVQRGSSADQSHPALTVSMLNLQLISTSRESKDSKCMLMKCARINQISISDDFWTVESSLSFNFCATLLGLPFIIWSSLDSEGYILVALC